MNPISLVIHGGAGTILRELMNPELETKYRAGLDAALNIGYKLLEKGGTAIDAVRAAVVSLEDNALFNAGAGSVFTKDGKHEMDASLMDGSNLMAGAVSSVKNIKNPIELAYAVMTKSDHVLLSGEGANEFAKSIDINTESDEYFFSQFRFDQWKETQRSGGTALDHGNQPRQKKFGTVGAAACDQFGNIAAATSTGGMTNKPFGRVGDSPIIGAGVYANNKTCAISCTGHGEIFLRAVAAYDVSCLMEYRGLSLQKAMEEVTLNKLPLIKGEGGMIGVDAKGNTALIFNSDGMYRGVKSSTGIHAIEIYK